LNFRSRKPQGQLFAANFSIVYACPDATYAVALQPSADGPAPDWRCVPIVPVFVVSGAIQAAVYAISGCVYVAILAIGALMTAHRNTALVRASSYPFCMCILAFLALVNTAGIFFALTPNEGSSICHLRAWLTGMALIGLLAAMLAKADRIRRIFAMKKLADRVAASNFHLALVVTALCGLEAVLLIALSAYPLTAPQRVAGSGTASGYLVDQCESTAGSFGADFTAWMGVQFAYVGLFLVAGLYISW
jgi:hypothetical protein